MQKVKYENIVLNKLIKDAIKSNYFLGFREDYLCLHALIKMFKIKNFLEIGTSSANGTRVIAKAMGIHKWKKWKNKEYILYNIENTRLIYAVNANNI